MLPFLPIHVDMGLHRYIPLRSGVNFRCVLVGVAGKASRARQRLCGRKGTASDEQEEECVNGQDKFASVASPQEGV